MSENSLTFNVARLHKLEGEGAMKAFVDLAINDSLLIKGLRIVEGQKGLFVSMPKEKGKDNRWYDTIRPLTKEAQAEISSVVLDAYKNA